MSQAARLKGEEGWTKNPVNAINQQNQVTEGPMSEEEPVGAAKIESCPPVRNHVGRRSNPTALRAHLQGRHMEDALAIEQEGRLPRCMSCGTFGRKVGASHGHDEKATKTSGSPGKMQRSL
jgi:hypothetical protein